MTDIPRPVSHCHWSWRYIKPCWRYAVTKRGCQPEDVAYSECWRHHTWEWLYSQKSKFTVVHQLHLDLAFDVGYAFWSWGSEISKGVSCTNKGMRFPTPDLGLTIIYFKFVNRVLRTGKALVQSGPSDSLRAQSLLWACLEHVMVRFVENSTAWWKAPASIVRWYRESEIWFQNDHNDECIPNIRNWSTQNPRRPSCLKKEKKMPVLYLEIAAVTRDVVDSSTTVDHLENPYTLQRDRSSTHQSQPCWLFVLFLLRNVNKMTQLGWNIKWVTVG